ncbi:YraN family protein [Halomonadaceae bacterium KBTZ08]
MDRRRQGQDAERAAADYLESEGMRILERNFTCRAGEIDLIGDDGDSLAFIEVRARREAALVDGATSVDERKQRKLIRAARFYLHRYGLDNCFCRFDMIGVTITEAHGYQFEWITNAFDATR